MVPDFAENVSVLDFPSPCGKSPAVFPNIFNLRIFRNFPVTPRRRSCFRDRKIFPAQKDVKYQYGQGAKCSSTNRGHFHSQNCNFPEERFILSSPCNSARIDYHNIKGTEQCCCKVTTVTRTHDDIDDIVQKLRNKLLFFFYIIILRCHSECTVSQNTVLSSTFHLLYPHCQQRGL